MPKKQTLEEFIKKSNIAHNFKYNYDKSIYINKQTKVIVICPEHGDFDVMSGSMMTNAKNALMRKISVPAVSSSARRMKNSWTTGTSTNCKVFLTSSLYLIINLNKGNYGFTSNI